MLLPHCMHIPVHPPSRIIPSSCCNSATSQIKSRRFTTALPCESANWQLITLIRRTKNNCRVVRAASRAGLGAAFFDRQTRPTSSQAPLALSRFDRCGGNLAQLMQGLGVTLSFWVFADKEISANTFWRISANTFWRISANTQNVFADMSCVFGVPFRHCPDKFRGLHRNSQITKQ
jgi:hypothetical protein